MYPSVAEERRFVLRLYEYWMTLRGDREMPSCADVHFAQMGKDADYCVMMTIAGEPKDAVLSPIGCELRPKNWRDADNVILSNCPPGEALATIGQHLAQTIGRRAPVSRGGYFVVRGAQVLGRAILLPLSEDGVTITHVLAGANYKDVLEAETSSAKTETGR